MKNHKVIAANEKELNELRRHRFDLFEAFETTELSLKGVLYTVRKGFTFTPFANPKPCNAHCSFCSEELLLEERKKPSSKDYIIDTTNYFAGLRRVLKELEPVSVNLSLSGLEASIDYVWLKRLLEIFSDFSNVREKVLYTNGSGLLNKATYDLILHHTFDKIELSRAHDDERINQRIMYFNKNIQIRQNNYFKHLVEQVMDKALLKISCILTKEGIATLESVKKYLSWLMVIGVKEVVFRELSILGKEYLANKTFNWINANRVEIMGLLSELYLHPEFEYQYSTSGYYYYNEIYHYQKQMVVIFETSSYVMLKRQNETNVIHKLIFHANGNLTTAWDSSTEVIANYYDK